MLFYLFGGKILFIEIVVDKIEFLNIFIKEVL